MKLKTETFYENSQAALKDAKLQRAINIFNTRFFDHREKSIGSLDSWDEWRDEARKIKARTINRLDEYLELLVEQVTKAGGIVHFSKDAEDARNYIAELAKARGVKLVVKGKSMTTEEIGLNEFLEEAGVEAVETDLGEYIVQLAGETPAHIIAPAIHKTRQDVGELFADKLGVEYSEEVEKLIKIARRQLREKFCNAQMGITGVNFAVAETGTIVIVENEGNARLSTSLPPIHVALMGIEKVIPTMEDLAVFLRVLPRSASGQKMSSYVSFITGPRRALEEDGPEELHLVILDNGRSRILQDEELRESLYCIRCGACLNACPVYAKIGGHAYGWVYSGPIGSVITPNFVGLGKAKELPFASSLCGACKDICPVRINIPHLLLKMRSKVVEEGEEDAKRRVPWLERMSFTLWALCMRDRRTYELASRLATLMQRPFVRDGKITSLPGFLSRWTNNRDLPPLASRTFRKRWDDYIGR
ncbi:MAG: LutB/LldF family L-lactate oxidation iron-sulfur protein [Dehalococcoidia bacterium]